MEWACGVTTVPKRRDLLDCTLASLAAAGFDRLDRLFLDGGPNGRADQLATMREPTLGIVGNWLLGMLELYVRRPHCDRYAMFQDDVVACRNLRQYLESCEYPCKGYLNLITMPENTLLSGGKQGWFQSNQLGRGAVGLVFSREALLVLLGSRVTLEKPQVVEDARCRRFPHKNLDGMIVTAMKQAGWKEYVHSPSLLQHAGTGQSTLGNEWGNSRWPGADTFPGEDFNALSLRGVT